jgi:hypothetical protein
VTRIVIAVMALLVSLNLAFAAEGERCKVTDPTGTPLNVRESPNGKIIGTLPNGTLVSIVEYKEAANGKPWVKVQHYETKKPIGWVFREYVSCF